MVPSARYKQPAHVVMEKVDTSSFSKPALNVFASTPQSTQAEVRARLVRFLPSASEADKEKYFIRLSQVTNHLPMETANFSDFYCSLEHARNVCVHAPFSLLSEVLRPCWLTVYMHSAQKSWASKSTRTGITFPQSTTAAHPVSEYRASLSADPGVSYRVQVHPLRRRGHEARGSTSSSRWVYSWRSLCRLVRSSTSGTLRSMSLVLLF